MADFSLVILIDALASGMALMLYLPMVPKPDTSRVLDANLGEVITPAAEELYFVVVGCLLEVDVEPVLMKLFILGLVVSTLLEPDDFKFL